MKTQLLRSVTFGALLALASALPGAAPAPAVAATPAPQNQEVRRATVQGYTLVYTLIDMNQMMASSSMPMTHGAQQMKSHHLMVNPLRPDGTAVAAGRAGYLIVQPNGVEVKVMTMLMDGGFGADVDLVAKGDYRITTKIVLGDTTLVDEFVHTVK